jgi:hypothetical protein
MTLPGQVKVIYASIPRCEIETESDYIAAVVLWRLNESECVEKYGLWVLRKRYNEEWGFELVRGM